LSNHGNTNVINDRGRINRRQKNGHEKETLGSEAKKAREKE
jgi:hypothetical protein